MTFRVLSLDGGGAWALIEVQALIQLYGADTRGNTVLGQFDLVAACSGGSLVLAGLVEDLTLAELLQVFMDEGKRKSLFSPTKDLGDKLLHKTLGVGPQYSAEAKLPAIERLLPRTGTRPLQGITADITGPAGDPVRLLIVGFDYERNRAAYFRSVGASKPGLGTGAPAPVQVTLAGAVHGSTNAPINYFDAPASIPFYPDRIWDGGVTGNNNPALAGLIEAVASGAAAPGDIRLLSIGTATVVLPMAPPNSSPTPFTVQRPTSSITGDLHKLATAILDDPPDSASFIAHVLTGQGAGIAAPAISRVVRMNPLVTPVTRQGELAAPDGWSPAQFQYLCNLDIDAIEQNQVEYINSWCQLWLRDSVPNQPLRMDGATLAVEVGYGRFSQAFAAWAALFPRAASSAIV